MRPNRLRHFKNLLIENIRELQASAGRTVHSMSSLQENFPDPYDRASLETERGYDLIIRERERRLIHEMQEALRRIEEGTFGICRMCGRPISEKRLAARPAATLCLDCKAGEEKLSLATG